MQQRLLSSNARGCERVPLEPQIGRGRKARSEEMEPHYAGIYGIPATGQDRFDKLCFLLLSASPIFTLPPPKAGLVPSVGYDLTYTPSPDLDVVTFC